MLIRIFKTHISAENKSCSLRIENVGIIAGQKQLKRALLFARLIVMVDFYRNHPEGFF